MTAAAVSAAATSRRARRAAAAGAASVQVLTEPETVVVEPSAVIADIVIAAAAVAQEPAGEVAERAVAATPDVPESAPEVVEPVVADADEITDIVVDVEAELGDDAFAAASEAFGFQSVDDEPTAVPVAADPVSAGATPEALNDAAHVAARRPRIARRVIATGASLGVMGIAGLIAVSMTLPVSAVAASNGTASTSSLVAGSSAAKGSTAADEEIQAFVASSDVQDEALVRSDSFSSVSMADVAAEEGIRFSTSLYTNDPDAAIQWPFKVGVAMSSPYGQRWGRLHAGIDLVPGEGAPIQAIADGTVRIATESGGAYGVTIYIDHVIDGQVVTSHYAHMQHGSMQVKAGDKVKVGDVIGHVGNTGRSYGAHLHFEIIINGSTVDPLPWMKKNAGRYEY